MTKVEILNEFETIVFSNQDSSEISTKWTQRMYWGFMRYKILPFIDVRSTNELLSSY